MGFKAKIIGNTVIIRLEGDLDDCSSVKIKEKIDYLLFKKDIRNLVFDMLQVSFMDSAGIGLLIGRYKQIKQRGGSACLILEDNNIKRILKMSGVLNLFGFADSDDEALEQLRLKALI